MQIGDAREKQGMVHVGKMLSASEEVQQDKNKVMSKEDIENRNAVTVDISKQALEMFERQLQASKESADAAGKAASDYAKIMEIARRIARGDKVPTKDEKKLMEYSSELYQMAKMSAMMNERKKHKKHKSLFEEEEENDKREKLRALESDSSSTDSTDIEGSAAETETGGEEAE